MNRILSLVRRCVEDYDMIQPNDRIAVGVSGGKDSLVLLTALAKLREFYPVPFQVEAFTLDMGHADGREGMDFTPVAQFCQKLDVPYTLLPPHYFRPAEGEKSLLHVRQDAPGCPAQCYAAAGHSQNSSGSPL